MYFGIPLDELPTPLLPPVSFCISFMWLGMNDSASADSDVACVNKICLHYSSEIQLTSNKKLFGAIIYHVSGAFWLARMQKCCQCACTVFDYSSFNLHPTNSAIRSRTYKLCFMLLILRAVANFYQINRFNRNYWKKKTDLVAHITKIDVTY